MPWVDMIEQMRKLQLPLFALESKSPLSQFDIVGFTLQYELSYTNILGMLDLAGIPFFAKDRGLDQPLIIAGGPCCCNAEPVADFFDIFSIGEGEQALVELARLYISMRQTGTYSKRNFLRRAAQLDGFYVPSLYTVSYHPDGTIAAFTPKYDDVPHTIQALSGQNPY